MLTSCTPFDEDSIDLIEKMKFDILKIASVSSNDWSTYIIFRIMRIEDPPDSSYMNHEFTFVFSDSNSLWEDLGEFDQCRCHRHQSRTFDPWDIGRVVP